MEDLYIYIYFFFDKKPFIMKIWNAHENFTKKKVDMVPTWIQLKGPELKYWGQKSLFKIAEQIGQPMKVDENTRRRDKLMFPRILMEVNIEHSFPNRISFVNEFTYEIDVEVVYE